MTDKAQTLSRTERTRELIEGKIDQEQCLTLGVGGQHGGIAFENMTQVMEAAKLMSVSDQAVPPHCRNKPGVCFALAIQAIEWKMSPFAVANKSYVVNDRVAYESQLIHAVIENRAPIQGRLRVKWDGEGDDRTCTVWATPTGEDDPMKYTSPPISQITPKNSPLWKSKPDLQLFYNTSRDWARMFFPDVIMGVYSPDEVTDHPGLITSHDAAAGGSRARESSLGVEPEKPDGPPKESKPAPEAVTPEEPKKKRGRPKGSKNKGDAKPAESGAKGKPEEPEATDPLAEPEATEKPAVGDLFADEPEVLPEVQEIENKIEAITTIAECDGLEGELEENAQKLSMASMVMLFGKLTDKRKSLDKGE